MGVDKIIRMFALNLAPILLLLCLLSGDACHAWINRNLPRSRRTHRKSIRRWIHASDSDATKTAGAQSQQLPMSDIQKTTDNKKHLQQSQDPFIRSTTFQTALVIVPPDRAWDSLQRARHFARDSTYTKWPPCIRLFHPFCLFEKLSDVAMDLALIVEEANLEPFDITLSQWTILPHAEVLQADALALESMPESVRLETSSHEKLFIDNEEKQRRRDIEELIKSEEKLGKARKRRRDMQQRERNQASGSDEQSTWKDSGAFNNSPNDGLSDNDGYSPSSRDDQKSRNYDEYDGPCVICLEPDAESQQKLQQLRDFLRPLLFDVTDYYSPTSSVSKTSLVNTNNGESAFDVFRPVVPIGTFSSVANAIPIARKLRGLLGSPLKFSVTDLHFISCLDKSNMGKVSWSPQDDEALLSDSEQFGCDAMVMLAGEEMEPLDEELGQDVAALLLDKGEKGGEEGQEDDGSTSDYDSSFVDDSDDDANDKPKSRSLEDWLYDDEEYDEGSVVVIGRTHFFTGENRMYVGMPAASSKVPKAGDRSSGEARRKNAAIQSQRLWSESNYGNVGENPPTRTKSAKPQNDDVDRGWNLSDE
ncbi:hypothetical protein MPSEU_000331200 [Mayamaea pseudoterrestris]|nr:hypothetical protein MPSEU_000331200 [Mayamaea pseudoterrestris]